MVISAQQVKFELNIDLTNNKQEFYTAVWGIKYFYLIYSSVKLKYNMNSEIQSLLSAQTPSLLLCRNIQKIFKFKISDKHV